VYAKYKSRAFINQNSNPTLRADLMQTREFNRKSKLRPARAADHAVARPGKPPTEVGVRHLPRIFHTFRVHARTCRRHKTCHVRSDDNKHQNGEFSDRRRMNVNKCMSMRPIVAGVPSTCRVDDARSSTITNWGQILPPQTVDCSEVCNTIM
jgi:hypothetical protein